MSSGLPLVSLLVFGEMWTVPAIPGSLARLSPHSTAVGLLRALGSPILVLVLFPAPYVAAPWCFSVTVFRLHTSYRLFMTSRVNMTSSCLRVLRRRPSHHVSSSLRYSGTCVAFALMFLMASSYSSSKLSSVTLRFAGFFAPHALCWL